MEYFVNLPTERFSDPAVWAVEQEARGWHGICASDHLLVGTNAYPHVFVTAMAQIAATSHIKVTTSFANNLFRSPVEFAQAAMALQMNASGRFEAGLGAGWAEHEMHAIGLPYPPPGERISRYIEALQVTRSLLATGQCQFQGDFYQVDLSGEYCLGPLPEERPPLIASAGGPRAISEVTRLVDRVEVKASARATRAGGLDFSVMATVTADEVKARVDGVKNIDADKPVSVFLLVGAGDDPMVQGMKTGLGNGFLGRFFGHPDDVARALEDLGAFGIDRVQLTALVPGTHEHLADCLIESR